MTDAFPDIALPEGWTWAKDLDGRWSARRVILDRDMDDVPRDFRPREGRTTVTITVHEASSPPDGSLSISVQPKECEPWFCRAPAEVFGAVAQANAPQSVRPHPPLPTGGITHLNSALLQLVDHPPDASNVAIGDRVCYEGKWSTLISFTCGENGNITHITTYEGEIPYWAFLERRVARIPAPLFELLGPRAASRSFLELDIGTDPERVTAHRNGMSRLSVVPGDVVAVSLDANVAGWAVELHMRKLEYPVVICVADRDEAVKLAASIEHQVEAALASP